MTDFAFDLVLQGLCQTPEDPCGSQITAREVLQLFYTFSPFFHSYARCSVPVINAFSPQHKLSNCVVG